MHGETVKFKKGLRVFTLPKRPICVPVTIYVSFCLRYQIPISFKLFLSFHGIGK